MNEQSVIESKVKASTTAAAVTGLVLWALGRFVFHGDVPDEVVVAALTLLPAGGAFLAGYIAPHTHRPNAAP